MSYFPAQLVCRRLYPQRSSGQAVVTGVVRSPPQYVPSFLSRIAGVPSGLVGYPRAY